MIVLKGRLIDGNGNAPIENGLVAVEGNIITMRVEVMNLKSHLLHKLLKSLTELLCPALLRDIAIWALATTTLDGLMSMYSTK